MSRRYIRRKVTEHVQKYSHRHYEEGYYWTTEDYWRVFDTKRGKFVGPYFDYYYFGGPKKALAYRDKLNRRLK